MGMLIEGKWEINPDQPTNKAGKYTRIPSVFRHQITKDGSSGFKAEPGRYHLYLSYACPWASRTLIFRSLKGLEDVISVSFVEPLLLDNGWICADGKPLYEIYQQADPNSTGKVTVPVLWDKKQNTIVNNESAEIIRMLNSEFEELAKYHDDYYPPELRGKIDEINDFIYTSINNGVYKCGFAHSEQEYNKAFDALFSALDKVEDILSKHRYLTGDKITEADWRLFTTLIRFDVVYYVHFKCNKKHIYEYPNMWNYLLELYQWPGVKETVNFAQIKKHYFASHLKINPTGFVAKGPEIDFDVAHNRAN